MVWFNGRRPEEPIEPELTGEDRPDSRLLVMLNASELDLDFVLPGAGLGARWRSALRTDEGAGADQFESGAHVAMRSLSLRVLQAA